MTITAAPGQPIIEKHGASRLLNFDMIVTNSGTQTYRIAKVELSAYDEGGHLASRKALNTDAFAPSITVIGEQMLPPGGTGRVQSLLAVRGRHAVEPAHYDFCFLREATPQEREANRHRLPDDCDYISSLSVRPRLYDGKTALTLPVKGKVFIWEGHDFYAHHLRVPLGNARVKAIGITANTNEFASDFIYTDAEGREYKGDPRKAENWFSYGKPIYAPGAGVVNETANDIPDNQFKDAKAAAIAHPKLPPGKDPKDIGNYVLIDHGNGEFSLLVHMKPGSVKVKRGDHVAQGQEIGAIGFAGDASFSAPALFVDGRTGRGQGLGSAGLFHPLPSLLRRGQRSCRPRHGQLRRFCRE